MRNQVLDCVLVPLGLFVMVAYHLWLLRQIKNNPNCTVIGVNAINRRRWVRAMMENVSKNGVLGVQTLRNNIMASTLLASTAIMLSSLILVNVPYRKIMATTKEDPKRPYRCVVTSEEYVGMTVNRGSYFWSLGLRAFYFSFPLFLWIFGPIPMFLCCVVLVFMLYFLDFTMDFGLLALPTNAEDECNGDVDI
ncbi:uncharacterized protein LOC116002377 [Ipomoea triloba]|uniref:uncharacterized protein LOC116002377 n=1 Tax=Ipomoea triloba TaxID=35885 RepID=UPI00125DF94C|nr:uncharacterized protein LOC116002377 [Ipomoea triloba]